MGGVLGKWGGRMLGERDGIWVGWGMGDGNGMLGIGDGGWDIRDWMGWGGMLGMGWGRGKGKGEGGRRCGKKEADGDR